MDELLGRFALFQAPSPRVFYSFLSDDQTDILWITTDLKKGIGVQRVLT